MGLPIIFQTDAHLASAPELTWHDKRNAPGEKVARVRFVAISNHRFTNRETGELVESQCSIQWTQFGPAAENHAKYLGKGSHVNVIGRIENNNYAPEGGETVYGFNHIAETVEYLDTKAEAEARSQNRAAAAQAQ